MPHDPLRAFSPRPSQHPGGAAVGARQRSWVAAGFILLGCLGLSAGRASGTNRVLTDQTGRRVSVPEHPQRLISLAPSITETLYALGAGDLLVGDTDYCDYPPEARLKPHVGALLNPNLERIVALKPDLVLGSAEANRRETADQLERLGIPLYGLTAHSLDETLGSLEDLGRVLGREEQARVLVGGLRQRIAAVEKSVHGRLRRKVLFVVWYRPLITVGPRTFIADVIHRAGGVSITDNPESEWPHLSLEEVLRRNPDVILFPRTESFTQGLEEFARLPGWKGLTAVKEHRLYFISDAVTHPSPRLVGSLEEIARILHPPAGAGAEPHP